MDFLGYVFVLRELQEQMQRRTIGAMTPLIARRVRRFREYG